MTKLIFRTFLILSALLVLSLPAYAQEGLPPGPVYIVQEGDTLSSIALRFGITVDDLVAYNNLPDANSLFVNDRLVIPGLEDVQGILETRDVGLGENMRSLSRKFGIPLASFIKLNRLVSPLELVHNADLVVPIGNNITGGVRTTLLPGQSMLELAAGKGENPWAALHKNQLDSFSAALPGDILLTAGEENPGPGALPEFIQSVETTPFFIGEAGTIAIKASLDAAFTGQLGDHQTPFFFEDNNDIFYAMQGIHALSDPGTLAFRLDTTLPDGRKHQFLQYIRVFPREYIFETITVPPELIDPDLTAQEMEMLLPYFQTVTPEKHWQDIFQTPARIEDCINSTFGNRRSYNGSAFTYYHAGADLCGGLGAEVLAPAPGTVIFSGFVEVRGNLTIIDHGWGIVSAYFHQSEIFVEPGDVVEPGEVIGLIGSTGRSTGPHLHWEIWVGGVPVNPLDWLENQYP